MLDQNCKPVKFNLIILMAIGSEIALKKQVSMELLINSPTISYTVLLEKLAPENQDFWV